MLCNCSYSSMNSKFDLIIIQSKYLFITLIAENLAPSSIQIDSLCLINI